MKQKLLTHQQRCSGRSTDVTQNRSAVLARPLRTAPAMVSMLGNEALDRLFVEARSIQTFLEHPVNDQTVRRLYELVKLTPTGFNSQPGRYVFVRSPAGKEQLAPALSSSNRKKMMAAPLTVIVGYDPRFYERLPELFPSYDARQLFLDTPGLVEQTGERNSTLQAAFLILAARALGLDAGPMSGFRQAEIDRVFFADGRGKTTMVINLGYGDRTALAPRGPRLTFEDTARIV